MQAVSAVLCPPIGYKQFGKAFDGVVVGHAGDVVRRRALRAVFIDKVTVVLGKRLRVLRIVAVEHLQHLLGLAGCGRHART